MDIDRFIQGLPSEYYAWGSLCSHPYNALPYIEVLDRVQGMTTPATMHLLNYAVQCMAPGECYLEVGTWRGATIIGALLGNDAQGYAIDNGSMTEFDKDGRKSKDVWFENIEKHHLEYRAVYIEGSVSEVLGWLDLPPIGVYFFDGDKSTTEAAYDALINLTPFLAPHALIVCDDANTPQIREAAFWFCHAHRDKATKLLDLPTPGNTWPSFWNGVLAIGWGVKVERVMT